MQWLTARSALWNLSGLTFIDGQQKMIDSPHSALTLMGVPIHDVTMDETVAWIARWVAEGGSHQIATVNPEFLMRARENAEFRACLERASLCIPDGIGVLWAARMRGHPLRERVAGSDLVPRLAREGAVRGWRIFFLGAAPGVAEEAAARLREAHPGLQVVGCYPGSPRRDEEDDIVARVQETSCDLLLVAYGAPGQDLWLDRNLARTGAAVGVGVGGSLRAPHGAPRAGHSASASNGSSAFCGSRGDGAANWPCRSLHGWSSSVATVFEGPGLR
jgi:N-acetylglucosaminyldiphosphoundecaprenol N-acetyl-beta-D-mannosaminyltransferase